MKIDWKSKLSSRKFWGLAAGFVASMLAIFKVDNLIIEQVLALIGSLSLIAVYIFTEGKIDEARASKTND